MTLFDFLNAPEAQQFENSLALLACMEQWLRLSRTDAAKMCNLNTATITHLSASLLEKGLLRECGKAQSIAGRKPTFLEFEPGAGYSLVLHLEQTYAQLTLHNLHHETVAALRLPPLCHDSEPEQYLKNVLKPSSFNADYGGILGGCIICGHDLLPEQLPISQLKELWQAEVSYPVYLSNAPSMTCLAEGHLRCPNQNATLLTLSISARQVSIGVLLGSQLLFKGPCPGLMSRRRHGITISEEDLCLNSLVLRAYQQDVVLRGGADYDATALLSSASPCSEICHLARSGNRDAISVIDSYADTLAGAVDELFRLYRPDLLILDGDILLYIEAINPALQKKLQANSTSPLEISTPFLGKLACAYGASRLCVKKALEQIPLQGRENCL